MSSPSKKVIPFMLVSLLMFVAGAFAQTPEIVWERTFGGADFDYSNSICATSDGNYVIAGFTAEGSDSTMGDVMLVKIDPNGDEIWTRIIGGPLDDYAYCIKQTSDNGFIIGGYTVTEGLDGQNFYLLKTNSDGNEVWHNDFGGEREDVCYSVAQTADGGYIMTGNSNSFINHLGDVYTVKTNSVGNLVWDNIYGGMDHDGSNRVIETAGGDFLIGGWTYSYGQGWIDAYLIKINNSGDILWTDTYGGFGRDDVNDIIELDDGNIVFTGNSWIANQNAADVFIVKLDSTGGVIWNRTYGRAYEDIGYNIKECTDGDFIIAGYTGSMGHNDTDLYMIKINAVGDSLWAAQFGGGDFDVARSIIVTPDDTYIMAGATASMGAGSWDYYVIEVEEADPSSIDDDISKPTLISLKQNYPNPFNASTIISFSLDKPQEISLDIYDILGRKIETVISGNYPSGDHSVAYDCSEMSAGIYLYRLSSPEGSQTMKLNLIK